MESKARTSPEPVTADSRRGVLQSTRSSDETLSGIFRGLDFAELGATKRDVMCLDDLEHLKPRTRSQDRMWTISAHDLNSLRGGGGQPFTKFVNSLLRTQCRVYGVPASAINTTLRVNVGDGGVDTKIVEGYPLDVDRWLSCPTAWQFKAVDHSRITKSTVVNAINEVGAVELVRQGYGYRICFCDEIPANKKTKLEKALNSAAKSIYSEAQACYVLSTSDLEEWANRFPGLVASLFNRPTTVARHWQAWQASELATTPTYFLPSGWKDYFDALQRHLQFAVVPFNVVLPVQGVAGVGKTRLVLEVIRQDPGLTNLVVYTDDDSKAKEAATWLANTDGVYAVLIADECSVQGRFDVSRILKGHECRIRSIAIDNTGEPPLDGAPGIWLEAINSTTTEGILANNFATVPSERRRTYAELSGGYIRLASDLCKHDFRMFQADGLGPAIPTLEEYYKKRISRENQVIVEAISLVQRIGHAGDVSEQLTLLATLTDIDPNAARKAAAELKHTPGFVATTPRFFYVTPQIIAEIAFKRAWRRLAHDNYDSFLEKIPTELLPSFELRVRGLADLSVRSFVSAHFQERVVGFKPADLADYEKMKALLDLLEIEPDRYLGYLARLIGQATTQELASIGSAYNGGRGTRREIVWAAERLASFPQYFDLAERILRRLALVETEVGIGNNATRIWRQLMRVQLSGTAVPFLVRFKIFTEMLLSSEPAERDLALGGLNNIVAAQVSRTGKSGFVGGRIPPSDWSPRDNEENEECLAQLLSLVESLLEKPGPLADAGWDYLSAHVHLLLSWNQLGRLEAVLHRSRLPDRFLGGWLVEIDRFLHYQCSNLDAAPLEVRAYCDRVLRWRSALVPNGFSGRLRAIVGKEVWHHSISEDIWKNDPEIAPLIIEVIEEPILLDENLNYLTSPDARSASTFGLLLGYQDTAGRFFESVMSAAQTSRSFDLLRGYVSGQLKGCPAQSGRLRDKIDSLEETDPEMAAEIVAVSIEISDAVDRLTRMVVAGKLHPRFLYYLRYGSVLQAASNVQFGALLEALAPSGCPVEQLKLAMELVGERLQRSEPFVDDNKHTIALMKDVVARSAITEDNADHWWAIAVKRLASSDMPWAAAIATTASVGDDYSKRDDASGILADLALIAPTIVMGAVGEAILNPETAWRWENGSNRTVFSALSASVVQEWLSTVGVQGARRIARHLPSPVVTPSGTPSVPEVTELVLQLFGDDAEVFREFAAGRHDMETSWGPISGLYEDRRVVASAFLNHPLAAISQWAKQERDSADYLTGVFRNIEEDEGFGH